jgi:hypothetical protein
MIRVTVQGGHRRWAAAIGALLALGTAGVHDARAQCEQTVYRVHCETVYEEREVTS